MNRGELKTRFKSIIDEVTDNTFDAARIEDLLYEGAQAVQQELELRVNDMFAVVAPQTMASDAVELTLPDDCGRVLALWRTDLEKPHKLIKTSIQDLYEQHREKYYYAVTANVIKYALPMDEEHTLDLVYSKHLEDLTDDDQSWDVIPKNAHSLIAYEAALLALASEESALDKVTVMYAKRRNNVLALFTPRDTSSMRQVKMVY